MEDNNYYHRRWDQIILNGLLVVSSGIVLLLVFERTSNSVSRIVQNGLLLPTQTVSIMNLTQDCVDVWKNHSQNTIIENKILYNYSTHVLADDNSFCQLVPKDISAAALWNENLHGIVEESSNVEEMTSRLLTAKLLQFLTPQFLELGHRSRPSRRAWGTLLKKIKARMESTKAPVIRVVAFGAGSKNCEVVRPGEETPIENRTGYGPESSSECLWPKRLEAFVNMVLNRMHHHHQQQQESSNRPSQRHAIINIFPMYHPPYISTTAEFDTAVVQNRAWLDFIAASNDGNGPDVILSAFHAHDMYPPERSVKAAEEINYYYQQQNIVQDFIRACLQPPVQCDASSSSTSAAAPKASKTYEPPLLIVTDDYVGNQQGPIMAENTQARVLRLLSDYYEIGFVSYAEVIRKLVYLSEDSPLEHSLLKDWTSHLDEQLQTTATTTASHVTENKQQASVEEIIQHGMVGPIAMTLTLAYSFLKYTVSFCAAEQRPSSTTVSSITEGVSIDDVMLPEAVDLVENIIPPNLDTNVTLGNIKMLWNAEKDATQEKCQQAKSTMHTKCVFKFWGGIVGTKEKLTNLLEQYIQQGTTIGGWTPLDGGRLSATQEKASLNLRFSLPPSPQQHRWFIRIFSVLHDKTKFPTARLQWDVSAVSDGFKTRQRRHRRALFHGDYNNSNTTKTDLENRWLQQISSQPPHTMAGIIEGTHDSPSTVALPTTIDIDPILLSASTTAINLKLELIEGNAFEIVGMFVCPASS